MPRGRRTIAIAILLSGVLAAACSGPRIHWRADVRPAPRPASAEVEVFVGLLDRPHRTVAVVESGRYDTRDDATKERMIEDLKAMARRAGADAVDGVQLLAVRKRGMVRDERVPLPGAVHQAEYEKYFLRGEAVVYEDDAASGEMKDTNPR